MHHLLRFVCELSACASIAADDCIRRDLVWGLAMTSTGPGRSMRAPDDIDMKVDTDGVFLLQQQQQQQDDSYRTFNIHINVVGSSILRPGPVPPDIIAKRLLLLILLLLLKRREKFDTHCPGCNG